MYNIRSYVKSEVESLAKANKVSLAADRIEGIDKGITTLKNVLNQLFPRDSDKFK